MPLGEPVFAGVWGAEIAMVVVNLGGRRRDHPVFPLSLSFLLLAEVSSGLMQGARPQERAAPPCVAGGPVIA